MSARARAFSHRLVKRWGLHDINERLIQEQGSSVMSGPFKGMILTPMTHVEHIGPFLLGTYETELHSWWEQVFARWFEQIIDVGAKFGYYAIGLAHRFPGATVVAFDTDWWARKALREMAAANRVGNLVIKGACTPQWLRENLAEHAFIISDCEGYEHDLFCSVEIPALSSATMIIEIHEHMVPGTRRDIRSRFAASHKIREVGSRSETPSVDLPIQSLAQEELRRASSEVRPPQTWLYLTPKPS